ncbi:MAG: OmpA family protein [Actinomycetota bacterium]
MRSLALGAVVMMVPAHAGAAVDAPAPARPDLLTFASGALPVAVGKSGAALGTGFAEAIAATDGGVRRGTLNRKPGGPRSTFEFVYELPAPTRFTRFAVPDVLETPSPAQSFVGRVEVLGSSRGPGAGFTDLAAASLTTGGRAGEESELVVRRTPWVRWVKVRLVGGVDPGATFFEFTELIGNGTQRAAPVSRRFTGGWDATFGPIELRQKGVTVQGCFDKGQGRLTGTVTGAILRASGRKTSGGTLTTFVLAVAPDGTLRGVRSDNGAPFTHYEGGRAPGAVTACSKPVKPKPALGCGSIVHGINFDFDSATIRRESLPVLAEVYGALRRTKSRVVIEGHTSGEGSDAYNQALSGRRAGAVVADLVRRGFPRARISAVGKGEAEPIATNDNENGRALNRRVEIECAG